MRKEEKLVLDDFSLGRFTSDNHATIPTNALLVARNVILSSGAPKPIPGYTKILDNGLLRTDRLFSFERQSDGKQFLMSTGGAKISRTKIDGSAVAEVMSTTQSSGDFDFIQTVYALYLNNGFNALKMLNIAGVETLFAMGLDAPTAAPGITIGAGTLTLTLGTRYVYSEVHQFTDDQGVTRFHISAPSPLSAHTGALAAKTVRVTGITKVNPNTTHFWIFRVLNSAPDASGDYFFVAEIPVASSDYFDSTNDTDLDTTRSAPFDNTKPPAAKIMLEYANRPVFMYDDVIQFGAFDEIDLGVPFECAPSFLRFNVPGGIKKLTAGIVFLQSLLASTEDSWFQITGTDIDTFSKNDDVVRPGTVGRKCVLVIHGKLCWVARDKKLWTWTGVVGDDPAPLIAIVQQATDQLSVEDLDADLLSECELKWYSNGTYDIAVLVSSSRLNAQGEKDWLQVWDLSPITGVKTIQGPLPAPSETDWFPTDKFSTALVAKDGGITYMYFGDETNGSVYRWPDGRKFNGQTIDAKIGTPWLKLGEGGNAAPTSARLFTNLTDASQKFQLYGIASRGVRTDNPAPVQIELIEDRVGGSVDPTTAKGMLNKQRDTAFGNYLKLFVMFPELDVDMSLAQIEVAFKELP
jgi:hypothetical protein